MDPETNQDATPEAAPAPENSSLLAGAEAPAGEAPAGEAGNPEQLDFVLDRYRAEGRSEADAAIEQAKGYNELRQKLGGFTGAPEAYEYTVPDEMIEQGVTIADDDPLMDKAREMAKEMNMSQEGFDKMVNMFIETQLYEVEALKGQKNEQIKTLGASAPQRLAGINQYINANFDAEVVSAIQGMVTTAESVQAVEALIKASRTAPLAAGDPAPAPAVTKEEVEKMMFETTASGQRRINTDPEFKAEYMRKRDLLWGTHEARTQIG